MTSTKIPKWSRCFFCSTPFSEKEYKASALASSANHQNKIKIILNKCLLNKSGKARSSLKEKLVKYLNYNEDGKAFPFATFCKPCGEVVETVMGMTLEVEVLQMKISYWMQELRKKIVANSRQHGDNLEIREEFDKIEKGLSEREANGFSCETERAFLNSLEEFQNAVFETGVALTPALTINIERLSKIHQGWEFGGCLKVCDDNMVTEERPNFCKPESEPYYYYSQETHFDDDHFFLNDSAPSPPPIRNTERKVLAKKLVRKSKKFDSRNMKKPQFKGTKVKLEKIQCNETLPNDLYGNIDKDDGNKDSDEMKILSCLSLGESRRYKRLPIVGDFKARKSQRHKLPKDKKQKFEPDFLPDKFLNSEFDDSITSSDDTDSNDRNLKVSPKSKRKRQVRIPYKKRRQTPRSLKSLTLAALINYKIEIPKDPNDPLRPVCDQCGLKFSISSKNFMASLERHLEQHEINIKPLPCPHCEKKFSQKQLLDLHVYRHGGSSKSKCDICSKYMSPHDMAQHMESQHGNVFPCLWCSNCYGDFGNLVRHACVHSKAKLKCALCPENDSVELSVHNSLPCHLYEKHQMTNMLVKCEEEGCCETFWNKKVLRRHIAMHSGNLTMRPCEYCEKSFASKASLYKHQINIHNLPNYQCGLCPAEFTDKYSLSNHSKIEHDVLKCQKSKHEVVRRFQCKKCEKKFCTSTHLRVHEQTHQNTKAICEICGYQANTKNSLRGHKVSHFGTRFDCPYCPKKFKRKWCLDLHVRIHTKEKPYQCEQCGSAFAQRSALVAHMKTHLKLRPN